MVITWSEQTACQLANTCSNTSRIRALAITRWRCLLRFGWFVMYAQDMKVRSQSVQESGGDGRR